MVRKGRLKFSRRACCTSRPAGGRAARHLLAVVKMMGDTSVATVNRHYFNLEDDVMQEIIEGWAVADVEVFAPDLEPVCAETAPDDDDAPAVAVQSPPRRGRE